MRPQARGPQGPEAAPQAHCPSLGPPASQARPAVSRESAPGQGQHLGDKLCPGTQALAHQGSRVPSLRGEGCCWLQVWTQETHTHCTPHSLSGPTPRGSRQAPPLPQHTSLREPEQCICLGGHRSRRGLEAPGGCATAAAAPPSPPASPSVGGGPGAPLPKSPWGSGAGGGVPASPGGATPAPRCRPPPPGPP